MPQLTDLAAELLLLIASFLKQSDLLNISLTSQRMRAVTEPELFREYVSWEPYDGRPLKPFVLKLLERPQRANYVQRLELKFWETLHSLSPEHHTPETPFDSETNLRQRPEPSEMEYMLAANAAKAAGIIDFITPYEIESSVLGKIKAMIESQTQIDPSRWYQHIYHPEIEISEVPFSQKFCMLLRTGIDDPYVVLLVHISPNIREIYLHGGPSDINALPWKLPHHKFKKLRRFSSTAVDPYNLSPMAYFDDLMQNARLKTLELDGFCDVWLAESGAMIPNPMLLQPASLRLTHLVLKRCTFSHQQLEILVEACPHISSFFYSYPEYEEYEHHPTSPAEVIDILKPWSQSLEELYIDMHPLFDDGPLNRSKCIQNLRCFSKLRFIDTRPNMWALVDHSWVAESGENDTYEEKDQLYHRFPQSIETIIFHDNPKEDLLDPTQVDYHQVQNLLSHRRRALPNLTSLTIIANSRDELRRFRRLRSIHEVSYGIGEQEQHFNFSIHYRKPQQSFTTTIFDHLSDCPSKSKTKWTGNAYKEVEVPIIIPQDPDLRDSSSEDDSEDDDD